MSKSKEQDFSPQSWYICCSSKWNKSIVTSIASSSLSAQTSHFWVEFLDLGHFTNKKPGYQDVKQLACKIEPWPAENHEGWTSWPVPSFQPLHQVSLCQQWSRWILCQEEHQGQFVPTGNTCITRTPLTEMLHCIHTWCVSTCTK